MSSPLSLLFLRLSPLLTSTAGLMCAWDQHFMISPFVHSTVPASQAGTILPHWFPLMFNNIIKVVATVHPLGLVLGLLNAFGRAGAAIDRTTKVCYVAGGVFALGHILVFSRTALRLCGEVWDKKVEGGQRLESVRKWLIMNRLRIATTDGIAWLFFLVAVIRSVEVKDAGN